MSRLPPVAKLPLSVRKNVRDQWETKKEDYEKELSEVLSQPWTIDIDPLQIFPYATSDWGKESTGSLVAGYVEGAISSLKDFHRRYSDDGVTEINTLCPAHVLTMDIDIDGKIESYNGAAVTEDGKLAILFSEGNLGSNIDQPLFFKNLTKALNEAPETALPMSFKARTGIKVDYEGKITEVKGRVDSLLKDDIKFDPSFEANFAKLKDGRGRGEWEDYLGSWTKLYMEALVKWLDRKKFGSDEMLREGLLEAVPSKTVVFRVVDNDKLSSTNEAVIEDEVLYLQTSPQNWGSNIDDVADKLMDAL